MRIRTAASFALGVLVVLAAWLLHELYLDAPAQITALGYQITAPLTIVIVLALLLSFAAGLVWRLFSAVVFFPAHVRQWQARRLDRKRTRTLTEGIKSMVLGNPQGQLRNFTSAGDAGVEPALTYYVAAKATEGERKEALLRKAENSDGEPLVKAMAGAQARLDDGSPGEAAEILRLSGAAMCGRRNPASMLTDACEQAGDLRGALDAGQQLLKLAPSEKLRSRISALADRLLAGMSSTQEINGLVNSFGKGRPKAYIAVPGAHHLARLNDGKGAERLLSHALEGGAEPQLLEAVAEHGSPTMTAEALSKGEKLLETDPRNPDLLRAVGTLAMRRELWAQARKFLERAAQQNPGRDNFLRLAELAEREGKPEPEISRLYRRAAGKTG